ncbi:MAG: hypothetical protein HRU47_07270 [Verrucomicrobiales bacterium]|nr:hypothetical protein [Verrucomicrobiales bacterium]
MSANGPDSRKPWCPVCEAHTDYHLVREDSSMHTCNECGSSTWKPTAPIPLTVVVASIVIFINFIPFLADPTGEEWIAAVAIWIVSFLLLRVVWNNWEHWRKFHHWKKKQRH